MDPNALDFLKFLGGILSALGAVFLKDAIIRTSFKHRLQDIERWRAQREEIWELTMEAQKKRDELQESKINTNREEIISMRERAAISMETFNRFYQEQKDESKENRDALNHLNRTLAGLDATMKGLGNWIVTLDKDIRRRNGGQ